MFELRFGSYSIDATFAGTPIFSRRKSTWRYCFLCPPPRCQMTISPWLLRPPERFFGSSNAFSGVSLVIWLLSRTVINRRDAVYGLKLFSPIATSYLFCAFLLRLLRDINFFFTSLGRVFQNPPQNQVLQILRVLDHLFAFGKLHVRFLPVFSVTHALAA